MLLPEPVDPFARPVHRALSVPRLRPRVNLLLLGSRHGPDCPLCSSDLGDDAWQFSIAFLDV